MDLQDAKALFNAQYLGQWVLWCDYNDTPGVPMRLTGYNINKQLYNPYLLLKSVNDLTDEEKLQVGIVAFPMFVPFPEKDHETLRKLALTVLDRGHLGSRTHQVLVRYGVLTPFTYIDDTGKPITLLPDDIIALGWAKYD